MPEKKAFHIEVGQRILQLRTSKKYTRETLAEMVGISDRFLYDIESGHKGCSSENLLGLSKALGATADYLLTGETDCELVNFYSLLRQLSDLSPDSQLCAQKLLTTFMEYATKQNEPSHRKKHR